MEAEWACLVAESESLEAWNERLMSHIQRSTHSFIHLFKLLLSNFYVYGLALGEFTLNQDRKDNRIMIWQMPHGIKSFNESPEERWIHSLWGPWNVKIYKWHLEESQKRKHRAGSERRTTYIRCMMFRVTTALSFPTGAKSCTMEIIIVPKMTHTRS